MPSPFPGMDPYLEDPAVWPGMHHLLAGEIVYQLNRALPAPYYATLEMRHELGIVAEPDGNGAAPLRAPKRITSDVAVAEPRQAAGGVAMAEPPARSRSSRVEFDVLPEEPARRYLVEVRDANEGHNLVTLLEILSPSHKRPGPDRDAYAAKQQSVLSSHVNLVEIDLLRTGRRVLPTPELEDIVGRLVPPPDDLVMASPAWMRRGPMWGYQGYPSRVREQLPCIEVPLRADLGEEVLLDLQAASDRAYDGGPYRRGAVDYRRPPGVPLAGEDAAWAEGRVRDRLEGPPG